MRRILWVFAVAASAGLMAGCVKRRYVITSDPPGAIVLRNGQAIGATPVDDHFVYYGKYHFTLIKDGYNTLQVDQDIPTPWYEYFPLDFISEAFVPYHLKDVHRFSYPLVPLQQPRTDELLKQAAVARTKGQGIGPPVATPVAPPPATPYSAPPVGPPAGTVP